MVKHVLEVRGSEISDQSMWQILFILGGFLQPDTLGISKRHYERQDAFTGSDLQTGPLVELWRQILGMEQSRTHRSCCHLLIFQSKLLSNCKVEFIDNQIKEAVFILQNTYGQIPVETHSESERKLRCMATYGGFVVDTMCSLPHSVEGNTDLDMKSQ